MKINNENKAKFFAQYWGQEVQTSNSSGQINWVFFKHFKDYKDIAYLPLKSLSQISDEDAIEVAKIMFPADNPIWMVHRNECYVQMEMEDMYCEVSIDIENAFISWEFGDYNDNPQSTIHVFDFLRSKGYALPWVGLSVEEMIEAGWIKLKEVNNG